jgi:hypothetical protein
MEAGHSPFDYSRVARELEDQRLAEAERRHQARLQGEPTRISLADPLKEAEKVQALYHALLEAKKRAGEKGEINFEQFNSFLRRKTEQLRKQMSCQGVEYEISVERGRVKLKAKGL